MPNFVADLNLFYCQCALYNTASAKKTLHFMRIHRHRHRFEVGGTNSGAKCRKNFFSVPPKRNSRLFNLGEMNCFNQHNTVQ